jgi:hypothetical protein
MQGETIMGHVHLTSTADRAVLTITRCHTGRIGTVRIISTNRCRITDQAGLHTYWTFSGPVPLAAVRAWSAEQR